MLYKKIIFLLILLTSCAKPLPIAKPVLQQPVQQVVMVKTKSVEVAWRAVERSSIIESAMTKKIILLQFSDYKNCEPCRTMKKTTFKDPKVVSMMNDHYIPIMADASTYSEFEYSELLNTFNIKSWPCTVFLFPDGTVIGKIEGYLDPISFLVILESIQKVLIETPSQPEANQINL